ncbi:MAG: DedA family protein [Thiotrichaceae bacterium]|nr:DedA family protein [Thiotrichaceae bacterium]
MTLFGTLYDTVIRWSGHRHATKYLATVSFTESFIFPIPVAIMLLPMCFANPKNSWRLATLTLIFSVLGGIVGYFIGLGAWELIEPYTSHYADKIAIAQNWFGDYGVWVVLMAGFSPIPYKVFTITAGAMSMAFLPFVVGSIIGRAGQFFLIASLVYFLGEKMEHKVRQYIEWIGWTMAILIGGVLLWLTLK